MKLANISVGQNFDFNLNGGVVNSGQVLQNNNILLLVPKIEGGVMGRFDFNTPLPKVYPQERRLSLRGLVTSILARLSRIL
jgi:hypothetical protein